MNQVYLSFLINNELFAISALKVLEALQKQTITKIPNAPAFIMGIINFRGETVPVFDTRLRFNQQQRHENDPFVIIVLDLVRNGESFLRIGAVVDSVRDVIVFSEDEIRPLPPMSHNFDTSFIHGVVRKDDRFILLLNIDKMFSDSEVMNVSEALQAGQ